MRDLCVYKNIAFQRSETLHRSHTFYVLYSINHDESISVEKLVNKRCATISVSVIADTLQ